MNKLSWLSHPWTWHSEMNEDGTNNGSVICGAETGRAYAICKAPKYMSKSDWQTIAPKLAASDDLYEALEWLRSHYVMAITAGDELELVDRALAKARGES